MKPVWTPYEVYTTHFSLNVTRLEPCKIAEKKNKKTNKQTSKQVNKTEQRQLRREHTRELALICSD